MSHPSSPPATHHLVDARVLVEEGGSDTNNDDDLPPLAPTDFECIGCSGVFPKSTLAPSNLKRGVYRCTSCCRARNKEWWQSDLQVNKLAHNMRRLKGFKGTGLGTDAVRKLLKTFGMRSALTGRTRKPLTFRRWDIDGPFAVENLVLLTRPEAGRHDKRGGKTGYPLAIQETVGAKLESMA